MLGEGYEKFGLMADDCILLDLGNYVLNLDSSDIALLAENDGDNELIKKIRAMIDDAKSGDPNVSWGRRVASADWDDPNDIYVDVPLKLVDGETLKRWEEKGLIRSRKTKTVFDAGKLHDCNP